MNQTLSSEENNAEDIVEQVHVKRIKRAKLSSVFEEDSEDDLPSMLSSAGTSTSTLNFSTEVASTATAQPFVLSHFSGLSKEFLKCLTCYPSLQVIPKEKKIAVLTIFIQLFSSWYFWNCSLDFEIISFHVQNNSA